MPALQGAAPPLRVRPYEARDGPAVRAFWSAGFQEMPWDITRTLGPIYAGGGPESVYRAPRPALAALAVVGAARGALAVARRDARAAQSALALAAVGVGGLAALHALTSFMIRKLCTEACATGDMADIAAHWQVDGQSAFFVAEAADGAVLGSVAVRRGGLADEGKAHGAALAEPDSCSVWKVSTRAEARGLGVARALMGAAEAWARDAGARRIILMTGSSGAKVFYSRSGYTLADGSMRGTELSIWTKTLHADA